MGRQWYEFVFFYRGEFHLVELFLVNMANITVGSWPIKREGNFRLPKVSHFTHLPAIIIIGNVLIIVGRIFSIYKCGFV